MFSIDISGGARPAEPRGRAWGCPSSGVCATFMAGRIEFANRAKGGLEVCVHFFPDRD
jgi:hypothetical protein